MQHHNHHNHHHYHQTHNSRMGPGASRTLFCASLFILIICAAPQLSSAQVYQTFQKLKIPDLIPVAYSTPIIKVELNGNAIKPGDPIPARSFRTLDIMKSVTWEPHDIDSRYTLMLLDLDRKPNQNGTLNIYNQYTNLNIPGNQLVNGQAIVAFDPPNVPCQPSTKHRLVMLAFHQDQNLDLADVAYISASAGYSTRRENFRLDDFIKRHRLHLVAANVFLAIGEVNGICSAGAALQPTQLVTAFMAVMIMVQLLALFRHRQQFS